MKRISPKTIDKSLKNIFQNFHNYVNTLNNSKLFAGLMIIVLNVASKFVTIKLSKTMESYLKFTFSRQILIFAIAWMGTRDIYIAFVISIVFMIFMDFLFNEESRFCCLPEDFTNYHVTMLENDPTDISGNTISSPSAFDMKKQEVSETDVKQALEILERAKKQNIDIPKQ